jgi:hypothetical protein
MKDTQSLFRPAARWITGGLHTSPSSALEEYAGLVPVRVNLNKMYQKLAVRLYMHHHEVGIPNFEHPPLQWDVPSCGTTFHRDTNKKIRLGP